MISPTSEKREVDLPAVKKFLPCIIFGVGLVFGDNLKKKVLLVRLSSLGDVVLCTSAARLFSQAGWDVSFLTKRAFADILRTSPEIREVFAFDKAQAGSEKLAREQVFQWVESSQFSAVVDLHDSWRTWMWRSRLTKTAKVFVLRKQRFREWLILFCRLGAFFGYGRGGRAKRVRDFTLEVLSALEGVVPPGEGSEALTQLTLPATKFLQPLPDRYLVLLPGGAWASKAWPHYGALAMEVSKNIPVVLLGSQKDEVCDAIAKQCASAQIYNLKGKTTLQESMAILQNAQWIVGNDTGFVHVAEALGKDVVVIEGPTHPYLGFSAYREKSIVAGLDLFCRPCSKSGKICFRWGSRKCLQGFSVAQVLRHLKEQGFPC